MGAHEKKTTDEEFEGEHDEQWQPEPTTSERKHALRADDDANEQRRSAPRGWPGEGLGPSAR